MDRRNFLRLGGFVGVSTASMMLGGCLGGGGTADDGQPVDFAQGVASGDPRPDSVMLWTRASRRDGQPAKLTLQFSDREDFSRLLVSTPIDAQPQWDYTVRHKVQGLAPATTYFYRFVAGKYLSPTGRTRTAPAADASPAQLKFAFLSCQDWSVNHWAAFEELAKEDLDFIVHLGDYIYETVGAGFQTGKVEAAHGKITLPDGTQREDGARYATTLADYRTLYQTYRSDPRIQALHARCPMIAVWDDHEFSDDCWQDSQTYALADEGRRQTQRRRNANQAWFEYMPADVNFDAANPAFDNISIYRDFRFGKLASLVMTDQRLYRADHVIPEAAAKGEVGSRYFVPQTALAGAEAQKMAAARQAGAHELTPVSVLGNTQRAWWQDRMKAADTTWKLWGNEVSLLRMQVDGVAVVTGLALQAFATNPQVPDALKSQAALTALRVALYADLKKAGPSGALVLGSVDLTLQGFGIGDAITRTLLLQGLQAGVTPYQAFLQTFLLNADQWDGYNAERKALLAHLQANDIRNVVALTGDIHAFFAGPVMADYDAANPAPVMVDLVTAGVSSNSLFSYFKAVVDEDPQFASLKPLIYQTDSNGQTLNTFNDTLRQFNPWLRHADTDAQGYALVTLDAARLSCEFRKVKPLSGGVAPAQPATASRKTVTVRAGSSEVDVGG